MSQQTDRVPVLQFRVSRTRNLDDFGPWTDQLTTPTDTLDSIIEILTTGVHPPSLLIDQDCDSFIEWRLPPTPPKPVTLADFTMTTEVQWECYGPIWQHGHDECWSEGSCDPSNWREGARMLGDLHSITDYQATNVLTVTTVREFDHGSHTTVETYRVVIRPWDNPDKAYAVFYDSQDGCPND